MPRQKWTDEEDEYLRRLVENLSSKSGSFNWNFFAEEMKKVGHHKTKKQIMDRWNLQLNPELNKSSISDEERRLLFTLQEETENSWKQLAKHFNSRTDNLLKNQFFLLVRGALRKASNIGEMKIASKIFTDFKPSTLLVFLKSRIVLIDKIESLEWKENYSPDIRWLRTSFSARKFIEFFAFTSQERITHLKTPLLKFAIQAAISKLNELNDEHLEKKKQALPTVNLDEKEDVETKIARLAKSVGSWVRELNEFKRAGKLELTPDRIAVLEKLRDSIGKRLNGNERSAAMLPNLRLMQSPLNYHAQSEIGSFIIPNLQYGLPPDPQFNFPHSSRAI